MSRSRANRLSQARLGLEVLQARVVPAVFVAQFDLDADGQSDDLLIVGDANRNNVVIHDNGVDTLTVSMDANGDGDFTDAGELNNATFTYSGTLAIVAKLGAAKDGFSYDITAPLTARTREITVGLGAGNDTANITAGDLQSGMPGGSRLDVDVRGGDGHDKVNFTTGKVNGSVVDFHTDLGLGSDTGNVTFGAIDNGSSVDVDADLGDGANTFLLDLQGVGKFQHADVHADIVGGIDADKVTASLHDDVGGGAAAGPSHLFVNADLGAGNDLFTTDVDYGGSGFRVDDNSVAAIAARGGAGDDTLAVNGIGNTGTIHIDPSALLDISLKGGAGNDKLGVNLDKTDALWVEGGVRVRLDGGIGNDTISLLLANNSTTTGNYDLAVYAGAGDDNVGFSLDNNGGTPTYGPNQPVIDGGLGLDTLNDTSKPISSETSFETVI